MYSKDKIFPIKTVSITFHNFQFKSNLYYTFILLVSNKYVKWFFSSIGFLNINDGATSFITSKKLVILPYPEVNNYKNINFFSFVHDAKFNQDFSKDITVDPKFR